MVKKQTKRGKPVAQPVPVQKVASSIFGCMAGTFEIRGDLLEPVVPPSDWEVNQ